MEVNEHLLALKVMRLTRPTLLGSQHITSEQRDIPQNLFDKIGGEDITSVNGSESIAVGQFMQLPQSFGNIYLGEKFSSYVCLHNCTPHPVQSVSVRADLQSNSTKINLPLHAKRLEPVTLGPTETMDDVIHHEVKETGTHILICEVSYVTPAGLPQSFRKFFKFLVVEPLDVKTKFYNAETDDVFLEAQIQNITAGTICLEKVDLESTDQYKVQSLNELPSGESVFFAKHQLQPRNSCQFLYCVKPIPAIANDPVALKAAFNIGKLDIVWRSNLGERGRLQTSQLQRSPIEYGDLRLIVKKTKSITAIGEPFQFTCRVTNACERAMELNLSFTQTPKTEANYTGSTEFPLGVLDIGAYRDFELTVFPVKLGLISITNLHLTDSILKRTYEFENFVQVFVVEQDYEESNVLHMDHLVQYHTEESVF